MASQPPAPALGSVLVIGGCGFFGSHLVRHLLELPGCGPISVISRNPTLNCVDGIQYFAVDITSEEGVRKVFAETKPQVVIQAAASRATDPLVTPAEHHNTIVNGTRNVISCAMDMPTTKAFVYTSTCAVAAGYEHFNIDETAPVWGQDSKAIPYIKAKAAADVLVRESNIPLNTDGKGLLTCSLRLPMVYGERDTQYIPAQLNALKNGQTKIQLGNGKNKVQPAYAGNAAIAHILAAQGLLASVTSPRDHDNRIDGEAFHIHDGEPQPFWEFTRRTWQHAGDETKMKDITVIPGPIALGMASMIEALFMIFTLGQKRPPLPMSRLFIQVTVYNATYSMEKARKRLGYNPVDDHDTYLKRSIAWELKVHGEKWPGMKAV